MTILLQLHSAGRPDRSMGVNGTKRVLGRPRKPSEESVRPELVVCVDGICESGLEAIKAMELVFTRCLAEGECNATIKGRLHVRNPRP